ncbi:MAG: transporter ATP-binding protein, partial [Rhodospirillales bacterium]|nr:transporter ATP-binding protein [Rhodospirillales bacterium]
LGAANVVETARLSLSAAEPGADAYALRPERIRLTPNGEATGTNAVAGQVREVAFRGDATLFVVALDGGGELRVMVPADDPMPTMGERVSLAWDADDLVPLAA